MREWIRKNISEDVASYVRIIYGGSVSSSTCNGLARQPDIDGFFVGSAALNTKEFVAIANSVKTKENKFFVVEEMEALGEEPEPPWHEFLNSLIKEDDRFERWL